MTGNINGVNIVQLPGVPDNVYPPQRKSFSMLRHLADNYINKYDWFVRLDDDAFISWPILEKLLRRLDPSQPLYIGKILQNIGIWTGWILFQLQHPIFNPMRSLEHV